jgi:hypothetical protein
VLLGKGGQSCGQKEIHQMFTQAKKSFKAILVTALRVSLSKTKNGEPMCTLYKSGIFYPMLLESSNDKEIPHYIPYLLKQLLQETPSLHDLKSVNPSSLLPCLIASVKLQISCLFFKYYFCRNEHSCYCSSPNKINFCTF